jgi:hypothetical protein
MSWFGLFRSADPVVQLLARHEGSPVAAKVCTAHGQTTVGCRRAWSWAEGWSGSASITGTEVSPSTPFPVRPYLRPSI